MKARHIFLLLPVLLWAGAAGLYAQSAQVLRTWLEHGVTQGGEQGMMAHVEFNVQGMNGVRGEAVAFIHSPKGTGWPDTNDRYCTTAGNVCASTYFTPSYDRSHFKDLEIFFPYSEMHLAPGEREYFCIVYIHDSNEYIANGEYVSFSGTGGSNTPAPQQQQGNGGYAAFPEGQTLYFTDGKRGGAYYLKFDYDNEGDPVGRGVTATPQATSFVLKSRDSQGLHFKQYFLKMETKDIGGIFGTLNTTTGKIIKVEGNGELTLPNDMSCIYIDGKRYQIITEQEFSRIFRDFYGENGLPGGLYGGNGNTPGGSGTNNNDAGRNSFQDGACKYCNGSGRCLKCQGSGSIFNTYGGDYTTCPSCSGSGRCFNCRGSGKQRTY